MKSRTPYIIGLVVLVLAVAAFQVNRFYSKNAEHVEAELNREQLRAASIAKEHWLIDRYGVRIKTNQGALEMLEFGIYTESGKTALARFRNVSTEFAKVVSCYKQGRLEPETPVDFEFSETNADPSWQSEDYSKYLRLRMKC